MPENDLELLISAARAAGKLALKFDVTRAKQWDKPNGGGLVTEVDIAVNAMLEDFLRAARPEYGWLSEESIDTDERLDHESVFIVDPIDGTRSFVGGSSTWAHSLAVARRGQVAAAVIYLPRRNLLYAASCNLVATLNGTPVVPSQRSICSNATVLSNRGSLDPKHWKLGAPPDIKRIHRPSLAYRLALVAQGRFDAALTVFPAWEWDVAAGDLILRRAGAKVTDITGNALSFNNPHPRVPSVVSAGHDLHKALIDRLRVN